VCNRKHGTKRGLGIVAMSWSAAVLTFTPECAAGVVAALGLVGNLPGSAVEMQVGGEPAGLDRHQVSPDAWRRQESTPGQVRSEERGKVKAGKHGSSLSSLSESALLAMYVCTYMACDSGFT